MNFLKKNLWLLILVPLLMAATYDHRNEGPKFPVSRYELAQQSFADDVTTATTAYLYNVNGIVEQIEVKVNDNDGDATATVAIASAQSGTLYSQAAIAEGATTVYTALSNKGTQDASFNPFLVCGTLTFTVTPSGDPGESGMTVDVYIYVR